MSDDRDMQRVLWRSRRGMLELDILLVAFARTRYAGLADADQEAYRALLKLDDWQVWDWLQRRAVPPPAYARIVDLIIAGSEPGA